MCLVVPSSTSKYLFSIVPVAYAKYIISSNKNPGHHWETKHFPNIGYESVANKNNIVAFCMLFPLINVQADEIKEGC